MRLTFEEKASLMTVLLVGLCMIVATFALVIIAVELLEIVSALGHIEGLLMRGAEHAPR